MDVFAAAPCRYSRNLPSCTKCGAPKAAVASPALLANVLRPILGWRKRSTRVGRSTKFVSVPRSIARPTPSKCVVCPVAADLVECRRLFDGLSTERAVMVVMILCPRFDSQTGVMPLVHSCVLSQTDRNLNAAPGMPNLWSLSRRDLGLSLRAPPFEPILRVQLSKAPSFPLSHIYSAKNRDYCVFTHTRIDC